jgi:type IV pilus assembly protein PilE
MEHGSGFTLVELIIVVIVIGILASIALPRYARVTERGRTTEAKIILDLIRCAQIRYGAQFGVITTNLSLLDSEGQSKYFTWSAATTAEDVTNDTATAGIARRNGVELPSNIAPYNLSINLGGNFTLSPVSQSYLL